MTDRSRITFLLLLLNEQSRKVRKRTEKKTSFLLPFLLLFYDWFRWWFSIYFLKRTSRKEGKYFITVSCGRFSFEYEEVECVQNGMNSFLLESLRWFVVHIAGFCVIKRKFICIFLNVIWRNSCMCVSNDTGNTKEKC